MSAWKGFFFEKNLVFIKWISCKYFFKNEWTLRKITGRRNFLHRFKDPKDLQTFEETYYYFKQSRTIYKTTKPNDKSFLTFKGFFAGLLGPPAGDGRPPGPPPVRLPGTAPTAPARLPGTAPTAPRFSLSFIGCSSMIKSSSLMSSKPSWKSARASPSFLLWP